MLSLLVPAVMPAVRCFTAGSINCWLLLCPNICRELVQQNELLRAKEAMQLTLLQGYEMTLQHLGMLASQGADSNQDQGPSFLPAVLLDVDALKLKETLLPHHHSPGAGNSSSTSSNNTESGKAASSNTSNSSAVSCSFNCSSSSAGTSRMQRLNAAITPSDLKALQGISVLGLAGEMTYLVGTAVILNNGTDMPQL